MTTNAVSAGGAVATDATMIAGSVTGAADVSTTESSSVASGGKSLPVDTVTLQGKVQSAVQPSTSKGNSSIDSRIGSVVFVYNWKGNLRVRYMDSRNSLVYQTPPVLLARAADLMMRYNTSVSARV